MHEIQTAFPPFHSPLPFTVNQLGRNEYLVWMAEPELYSRAVYAILMFSTFFLFLPPSCYYTDLYWVPCIESYMLESL